MDYEVTVGTHRYGVVEEVGYLLVVNKNTGKEQVKQIEDIPYGMWEEYNKGKQDEMIKEMIRLNHIQV